MAGSRFEWRATAFASAGACAVEDAPVEVRARGDAALSSPPFGPKTQVIPSVSDTTVSCEVPSRDGDKTELTDAGRASRLVPPLTLAAAA